MMWLTCLFAAHAEPIAHGHTPPETVKLFRRARQVSAEGQSKAGSCEEALAEAWEDLNKRIKTKKGEVIVAVWPMDQRNGWKPMETVECEAKKKKVRVEMEALVSRPGTTDAFPELPTARILELSAYIFGKAYGLGIMTDHLVDVDGSIHWKRLGQSTVSDNQLRNRLDWAVIALNGGILPELRKLGGLQNNPEIQGIQYTWVVHHKPRQGDGGRYAFIFDIDSRSVRAFRRGRINEREVVRRGTLQFVPDRDEAVVMNVPLGKVRVKKDK